MKIIFALVLAVSLSHVGCIYKTSVNNFPTTVKQDLTELRTEIVDYRLHPEKVTVETRNNLVDRLVGVADDRYVSNRNRFMTGRSAFDFAGEVASTTLSAVSALVGGGPALSAGAGLATSTQVSVDKNFFNSISTQTLVVQMDSQRAAHMTAILMGENMSVTAYGLETALNEVRQYDDAGTIQAALISLTATANAAKAVNENLLRTQRSFHKQ